MPTFLDINRGNFKPPGHDARAGSARKPTRTDPQKRAIGKGRGHAKGQIFR
jgi:hypothetical protein